MDGPAGLIRSVAHVARIAIIGFCVPMRGRRVPILIVGLVAPARRQRALMGFVGPARRRRSLIGLVEVSTRGGAIFGASVAARWGPSLARGISVDGSLPSGGEALGVPTIVLMPAGIFEEGDPPLGAIELIL